MLRYIIHLFICTNLFFSFRQNNDSLVSRVNFKYGKPEPVLIICHKNSKNMDAMLKVVKY